MATSPATPVIYSIKFLVFNSFTADFFAPKNGKCCKNQPVICSLHIFFVFSLFQHLLSNKHSLFSWKQSTKFTWLKYYQICQFYFITLHISFFFQVQLVSLRNFAAFWLSLLGIEKHQTHYRFLRWTNFLVLMSKIVFFPELKLFLIHPITILQVNLS